MLLNTKNTWREFLVQVLVISLWYLAYFSSCGLLMSYAVTCEINTYNTV